MISYLPFISILVLLISSALTPIVYRVRRSLTLSWLVATTGSLVAWILTLLAGTRLPMTIPLLRWRPAELFPDSPVWLVDPVSWPFAMALSTLALAVILTEVAREFEAEASSWAITMALAALGIASVYSGNPVTLLLGWAALDIAELLFLLLRLRGDNERRQAMAVFFAKAGGIFLFLYGLLLASSQGLRIEFDKIPQNSVMVLFLAVSLRLGVVPLHVPFWREPILRRGVGTITRLVPPAASLAFLVRVAAGGIQANQHSLLYLLTALAAIYAGFSWYNASEELEGRPFFILGMAALALGSALQGRPGGSLAWGVTLVFSGGFLFLYSSRNRFLRLLAMAVVASAAGLPFTPSWNGGQIYAAPLSFWLLLFGIAHVLMLAGFVKHSWQTDEVLLRAERWVQIFYPAGILLLVVSSYLAAWWSGYLLPSQAWAIGISSLLPGLLVLGLMAARIYWGQSIPRLPPRIRIGLRNIFSLGWFYALLGAVYRLTGRAIAFVTQVLEGEGGVLWALLLLTLLIAFLTGRGVMGG